MRNADLLQRDLRLIEASAAVGEPASRGSCRSLE